MNIDGGLAPELFWEQLLFLFIVEFDKARAVVVLISEAYKQTRELRIVPG